MIDLISKRIGRTQMARSDVGHSDGRVQMRGALAENDYRQ